MAQPAWLRRPALLCRVGWCCLQSASDVALSLPSELAYGMQTDNEHVRPPAACSFAYATCTSRSLMHASTASTSTPCHCCR